MSQWKDKTVLITGGSSGLGLHLARAWGAAGAQVLLLARDESRLAKAAEDLAAQDFRVQTRAADITDHAQVAKLRDWILTDAGGQLDVLVNAAGKSDRGRVSETTLKTLEELWRLNFLATVDCTQTLLPLIRESSGNIVNIGSLASKTAAPFIGAYPTSKFPVAAFSQQLRLELAEDFANAKPSGNTDSKQPPHVLLVCPGPIARDDAGDRYGNKTDDLPESAQKPGGGARVSALDPVKLSQQIIRACERRQVELVLPAKSRFLFAIQSLFPAWGDRILRRMTRK